MASDQEHDQHDVMALPHTIKSIAKVSCSWVSCYSLHWSRRKTQCDSFCVWIVSLHIRVAFRSDVIVSLPLWRWDNYNMGKGETDGNHHYNVSTMQELCFGFFLATLVEYQSTGMIAFFFPLCIKLLSRGSVVRRSTFFLKPIQRKTKQHGPTTGAANFLYWKKVRKQFLKFWETALPMRLTTVHSPTILDSAMIWSD